MSGRTIHENVSTTGQILVTVLLKLYGRRSTPGVIHAYCKAYIDMSTHLVFSENVSGASLWFLKIFEFAMMLNLPSA